MAYSYIIIEFTAVPADFNYFGIDESVSGFGLYEIFRTLRTGPGQTEIPSGDYGRYTMAIDPLQDITDVSVQYTFGGVLINVNLSTLPFVLNGASLNEYELFSETPVLVYEYEGSVNLWPIGSFSFIEVSPELYTGYISENYKEALDLDFNGTGLFTIENTNGGVGSGVGTVKITANYPNAIFSINEDPAFANITISNGYIAPPNGVAPENLAFNVDAQIPDAPGQEITITAETDSWSIADTLPDWLVASAMSGDITATVTFTPVNYAEITSGTYNYTILVTIGGENFEIPVVFNVTANISNPFLSGNLYFTEAEDFLIFNLDTTNTFVELEIVIMVFDYVTNTPTTYNRSYNLPLFKGSAEFHVGSIVNDLFDELKELSQIVSSFHSNYVVNQYRPAEVLITFEEKAYGEYTGTLSSGTLPMFKMAHGHKPFTTENQLALLTVAQQDVIRITKNSPIATSFVFFGTPRVVVKKNSTVIEDFEIPETENILIYSYYRFINDLKVGDSIEILIINDLETRSQRFLVMPTGQESTFFIFENKNLMLEPFEFTGRRRINSNLTFVKKTTVKKLHSYEKKAFSKNVQPMIVNSGQLTKTEHRVITALCESENVWCSLDHPDGPYFRVDAITTKIVNQDTSVNEESIDVEFNILENAHASLYPY